MVNEKLISGRVRDKVESLSWDFRLVLGLWVCLGNSRIFRNLGYVQGLSVYFGKSRMPFSYASEL